MSEPEATTAEETTAAAGRGRPRPDETVERDAKVLAYLTENGSQSRAQIVTGTGIAGNQVYLSLYRLSRGDTPSIKRDGSNWSVITVA